jgi:hypothetical protein
VQSERTASQQQMVCCSEGSSPRTGGVCPISRIGAEWRWVRTLIWLKRMLIWLKRFTRGLNG